MGAYRTDLCLHQDPSVTTIATYGHHIGVFRLWLADHYPDTALPEVQGIHVKAYLLSEAGRGIAPATRSSTLFVLRSFYEFLRSEDLINANPTAKIRVPGARKLHTEVYTDAEADLILAWAASQPKRHWRVGYVVLATLRRTGLRRNEIAMLHLDQVDFDARRISFIGKGDKEVLASFSFGEPNCVRSALAAPSSSSTRVHRRAGRTRAASARCRCRCWSGTPAPGRGLGAPLPPPLAPFLRHQPLAPRR